MILYDKTAYQNDAAVVDRILRTSGITPIHLDMREPHIRADIQIHIRIPVYSAVSWAYRNILLVHPDQWVPAFDAYLHAFDVYSLTDQPWCSWFTPMEVVNRPKRGFVSFVSSTARYNYMMKLLPCWTKEDPSLTIYTDSQEYATAMQPFAATIVHSELTNNVVERHSKLYLGHLVCSEAETLDYSALHAEAVGAFVIANDLPYYKTIFNHVAWLTDGGELRGELRGELDKAFTAFNAVAQCVEPVLYKRVCKRFAPFFQTTSTGWIGTPILAIEDCPSISIITPTYNRRHMIDIAFHNLLSTDYPHDKIEWIIVEDHEHKDRMATDKVVTFQVNTPTIAVKYIPIEGRLTIGEKRNYGINHATHDIILFMDDDDHYPVTSFRRRVAWLTSGNATIACCTTLPLYDLMTGASAVSIPPFQLPLSKRISEATLTFKKSAWVERSFSDVSIAEGDSWIAGREASVVEIPPQQIIVAFSHGRNQSSRIVPSGTNVSCFWGFPNEYLQFIHGLAGVTVESA